MRAASASASCRIALQLGVPEVRQAVRRCASAAGPTVGEADSEAVADADVDALADGAALCFGADGDPALRGIRLRLARRST